MGCIHSLECICYKNASGKRLLSPSNITYHMQSKHISTFIDYTQTAYHNTINVHNFAVFLCPSIKILATEKHLQNIFTWPSPS